MILPCAMAESKTRRGQNLKGTSGRRGEGERRREAHESHGAVKSCTFLYALAELGDTTGSSSCLCQPLLSAEASPREELSPRAESQDTWGNLSPEGSVGLPALQSSLDNS